MQVRFVTLSCMKACMPLPLRVSMLRQVRIACIMLCCLTTTHIQEPTCLGGSIFATLHKTVSHWLGLQLDQLVRLAKVTRSCPRGEFRQKIPRC